MYIYPFRTDTMYEDALISKMFVFSFVNSYASLFFVAFIKTYIGESCTGGCFSELSYQLTTIFGLDLCPSFVNMLVVLLSNNSRLLHLQRPSLQWRRYLLTSRWLWIGSWRIGRCRKSMRSTSSGYSGRRIPKMCTSRKSPRQRK